MKTRLLLATLLLIGSVPVSDAQSTPFLDDKDGDVALSLAGTPSTAPAEISGPVDLKALFLREVPQGFEATLQVRSLSAEVSTFLQGTEYRIYFVFGGIEYVALIQANYGLLGEGPYYYASLAEIEREDDWEFYSYRAELDVEGDAAANTLTFVIPRRDVTDALGAPAGAGTSLDDFYVVSDGTSVNIRLQGDQGVYEITDRMPDSGLGGSFEAMLGVIQSGDASLSSEAPFRLSNGGATSMVYQVNARNAGERQTFALAASNLPEGWEVELPFDRIALESESTQNFPVLVTTPNKHIHGGSQAFLLTMTGQQDKGDVGRLEIGVTYPLVPQPAGHHPQLWIHSAQPYGNTFGPAGDALGGLFGSSTMGYMNAVEEDAGDLGVPIPAWGNNIPALQGRNEWWIPLVPDLGMGLDFDITKKATLNVPIQYDYIAQDVVVSGSMYLWTEAFDGGIEVGTIQPSTPTSWGPGQQTFELVMDIKKEADFVPYSPHAYLYLELVANGQFLGVGPFGPGAQPSIMPGASIVLPLNEYHDEVQSFYSAVESLRFDGDFIERPVNPGKTVVFETHLRNLDAEPQPVLLNLSGVNLQWARILGDTSFELGAGQERTVAVAVAVPADAADGGIVDLVLTATNADDPFRSALLDLIAVIDTETDLPDEAGKVGSLDVKGSSAKKAPGFEITAIALGLLAIALMRRRR